MRAGQRAQWRAKQFRLMRGAYRSKALAARNLQGRHVNRQLVD
jgi:hypothetical protein